MESPSQNQTGSYLRYRLLSTVGGKFADALGVIIAIKTLSPADYGVVGTALGVVAVVGFLNLTPEDILWRDLPRLRDRLGEHLAAFVWFWFVKLGVVAVAAGIFCAIYGFAHHSLSIAAAIFRIALWLQILTASALVEVPLFASLRPQKGTIFVLGVRLWWLALLVPNFWFRSLAYYVMALGAYATVTAVISGRLLRRQFGVHMRMKATESWPKVREAALEFTLWLHLVGRTRAFFQRGDLAILGGLGLALAALGQYTVAINLVGFAFILPGVLENVTAVTFAHAPQSRRNDLWKFSGVAVGLSAMQLGCGWLFAAPALQALRVVDADAVAATFRILLAGTSVMTMAGPALAYAMCFRKMRSVFAKLFLPAAVVFALAVWWAGRQWGADGAAWAHASVSAAAGVAVMIYVWTGRDDPSLIEPATAEAELTFQE